MLHSLNLSIHKSVDSKSVSEALIKRILNKPIRYCIIENIESSGTKSLTALAYVDLINDLIIFSIDNKKSFMLCNLSVFMLDYKAVFI